MTDAQKDAIRRLRSATSQSEVVRPGWLPQSTVNTADIRTLLALVDAADAADGRVPRKRAIEAAASASWNLQEKSPEERDACIGYVLSLVNGERRPNPLTDGPMVNVLRALGIEVPGAIRQVSAILDTLLFAALPRLAAHLPAETFHGQGGPYLSRYTLLNLGGKDGWRIHLHHFHRGDEDRELHSHPWLLGLSLILAGGYSEERRRADDSIERLEKTPGSTSALVAETFHRVDLLDQRGCWTLFASGPVRCAWGFWNRDTGSYLPWREFIRRKGLAVA